MEDKQLKLTFDPSTIEHLGIKMYSTLPPALAELIANAYDACATTVTVELHDSPKSISVVDDGTGMTFDEINDYYLRIGRNRRKEGQNASCERFPTGKKGLGKLALFGIGKKITVTTCKDGQRTSFTLDWDSIMRTTGEYIPKFNSTTCNLDKHGTEIIVEDLKRKTNFSLEDTALSIAKLFNFNDDDFKIIVKLNSKDEIEINRDLKYKDLHKEFEWELPLKIDELLQDESYAHKSEIKGTLFTTEKPLRPGMRGITLYANGRMVNLPEFFGVSESSHFFSYLTGYLDIDFVDRWDEDVISTDRQSLDWDHENLSTLRAFLQRLILAIAKDWRAKRKEKREEETRKKTGINTTQWLSKTPELVKEKLEEIISTVSDNENEISSEKQAKIIETIHELVPEYPLYHWRHIHPKIKEVSQRYYESGDYYTAFLEALKRYISEVKKKSGSTNRTDRSLMGEVFSGRKLSVTSGYKKSDGTDFSTDTINNIEEGQQALSEGIVVGGRNPLSHEEHRELSVTGLFSEKDCLDFLSILSHLFKRLEESEVVTT